MRDNSGSYGFQYNAFGELSSETATINNHTFTTSYSYNDNGELMTVTYPGSSGDSIFKLTSVNRLC